MYHKHFWVSIHIGGIKRYQIGFAVLKLQKQIFDNVEQNIVAVLSKNVLNKARKTTDTNSADFFAYGGFMKRKLKMRALINAFHSTQFDPNGSYTGNPQGKEKPVQDADDL